MHRLRLTRSERRLWNAYPSGAMVTVRRVRAEVVSALLLGVRPARPGRVPAVRLRGAHITGKINVSGGVIACPLLLLECTLDETPDFSNARTRQLRLGSCRMPGFDGGGLQTDGYLSLSKSIISGEVRLVHAQLTGGLRLNNTKIVNPGAHAVLAGGCSVEAGLFARGADISGTVRLTGGRLPGGFFLERASLRAPGDLALMADSMVVDDAMECSQGFSAEGTIRLRGAHVNCTLSFDGARLHAPGTRALHLSHTRIQELILLPAVPIEGVVNLAHARIGLIADAPETWPAQLRLNGLVYETLRGRGDRTDWVARDPKGLRTQPYEQLAEYRRRSGRDDQARQTLLAKLRAQRRQRGAMARAWGLLLDVTVGYGYRPWIAAIWLALLSAAGSFTFTRVRPVPLRNPDELPDFNPFIYTLDLLIPIETFGLRSTWQPIDWTRWLAYGLIVAGWILATALIAGAARVLRRT